MIFSETKGRSNQGVSAMLTDKMELKLNFEEIIKPLHINKMII